MPGLDQEAGPADVAWAQMAGMSLLRLLQFKLEQRGEEDHVVAAAAVEQTENGRPSILDVERLLRRHREQIQRLLSKWAGDEGNTEGDAA